MAVWDWDEESLARLADFLARHGLTHGPVRTSRIGDGHSNLTYLVRDRHDHRVVVRRPPPPPSPPGAHDMLREARLIGALAGTSVPVAQLLVTAAPGELLDLGCYVMSFVAGPVVTTSTPAPLDRPEVRRRIGHALVDTLADLHRVDWRAAGLGELGHPEGFNARHLRRMARLVADGAGAVPPAFAPVHDWLAAHIPAESGAAIVHNDFRLGNVVLSLDQPGEIAAVLDWELATIGDPLFDLGYFLASVPAGGNELTPTQEFATAMLEPGWPSRNELAERYAARTGASLDRLEWYATFALWKLAVLYDYSRRRAGDPYYADPGLVRRFLDVAHDSAGLSPASRSEALR